MDSGRSISGRLRGRRDGLDCAAVDHRNRQRLGMAALWPRRSMARLGAGRTRSLGASRFLCAKKQPGWNLPAESRRCFRRISASTHRLVTSSLWITRMVEDVRARAGDPGLRYASCLRTVIAAYVSRWCSAFSRSRRAARGSL